MCPDCVARRERIRKSFLESSFKKGAVEIAKGAAELIGLKEKSAAAENEKEVVKQKPTSAKLEKK